jgi:hypothetical protein
MPGGPLQITMHAAAAHRHHAAEGVRLGAALLDSPRPHPVDEHHAVGVVPPTPLPAIVSVTNNFDLHTP